MRLHARYARLRPRDAPLPRLGESDRGEPRGESPKHAVVEAMRRETLVIKHPARVTVVREGKSGASARHIHRFTEEKVGHDAGAHHLVDARADLRVSRDVVLRGARTAIRAAMERLHPRSSRLLLAAVDFGIRAAHASVFPDVGVPFRGGGELPLDYPEINALPHIHLLITLAQIREAQAVEQRPMAVEAFVGEAVTLDRSVAEFHAARSRALAIVKEDWNGEEIDDEEEEERYTGGGHDVSFGAIDF